MRMQYSKEPPDRSHVQHEVGRSLPPLLFMVPRPADNVQRDSNYGDAREQGVRWPDGMACPPPVCPPSLPPRTHASQISRAAEAAAANAARGPKHQNGRPTATDRPLVASFVFLHNKWPLCMILSRPRRRHSHSCNDGIIFVQSRTCELSCKHSTKSTAKTRGGE